MAFPGSEPFDDVADNVTHTIGDGRTGDRAHHATDNGADRAAERGADGGAKLGALLQGAHHRCRSCGAGGARQRVKRVPTVFGTNASPKRRPMACWARHPVQCAGTRTCGAISARSSRTRGIRGSNSGPFRWKPPIAAYSG